MLCSCRYLYTRSLLLPLLGLVFCWFNISAIKAIATEAVPEAQAKVLFEQLESKVFQLRIIEIESGEKSSIGSGFLVNDRGWIVSNYHVVAQMVNETDKYRIELVSMDGSTRALKLLDFDVIHDLALLSGGPEQAEFIAIEPQEIKQGSRIFSLGNPRDLGMTVVEGNYNGLLKTSMHKKILISGSLNPGMSGGPAVDYKGDLIGVNVATQGNQISFLVPVSYLTPMLTRQEQDPATSNFTARIGEQLAANQQALTQALINADWPLEDLGPAKVPGAVTSFIKCWGGTPRIEKALFQQTHKECFSDDRVFLRGGFDTGTLVYSFSWYRTDEVNSIRFYSQFEQAYKGMEAGNSASREDVDEYHCQQKFLDRSGRLWRGVMCAREYKKYPGIYDVAFIMASLFESQEGLIADFSISGVEKSSAIQLVKKFLEQTQWNSLLK